MTLEQAINYLENHAYIDDEVKDFCIDLLKKEIEAKERAREERL